MGYSAAPAAVAARELAVVDPAVVVPAVQGFVAVDLEFVAVAVDPVAAVPVDRELVVADPEAVVPAVQESAAVADPVAAAGYCRVSV